MGKKANTILRLVESLWKYQRRLREAEETLARERSVRKAMERYKESKQRAVDLHAEQHPVRDHLLQAGDFVMAPFVNTEGIVSERNAVLVRIDHNKAIVVYTEETTYTTLGPDSLMFKGRHAVKR